MKTNRKVTPGNFTLVFDDLSALKEDEHRKAFGMAVGQFINCISLLISKNAEIFIPAKLMASPTNWLRISELQIQIEEFANALYFLEDYEFRTKPKNKSH